MLVMQGRSRRQHDPPAQKKFAETYKAGGGRHPLELFEGCEHEWVAKEGPQTDRAREMVKAFIARMISELYCFGSAVLRAVERDAGSLRFSSPELVDFCQPALDLTSSCPRWPKHDDISPSDRLVSRWSQVVSVRGSQILVYPYFVEPSHVRVSTTAFSVPRSADCTRSNGSALSLFVYTHGPLSQFHRSTASLFTPANCCFTKVFWYDEGRFV
jgi:hypothetical protein